MEHAVARRFVYHDLAVEEVDYAVKETFVSAKSGRAESRQCCRLTLLDSSLADYRAGCRTVFPIDSPEWTLLLFSASHSCSNEASDA